MNDMYKNLEKTLSTTDLLAIERNMLANERTLLAYMRTFLSFVVAGVSLIQFFQYKIIVLLGYMLIPLGVIIQIVGFIRYNKTKKSIDQIRQVGKPL